MVQHQHINLLQLLQKLVFLAGPPMQLLQGDGAAIGSLQLQGGGAVGDRDQAGAAAVPALQQGPAQGTAGAGDGHGQLGSCHGGGTGLRDRVSMEQTTIHLSATPMAAAGGDAATLAALKPLFAPYCAVDGNRLEAALALLMAGRLEGCRPLQGSAGHPYQLCWSGVLAPLDIVRCELTFPQQREIHYAFALQAYHLLGWLACIDQRATPADLPEDFWRWLILGDASAA